MTKSKGAPMRYKLISSNDHISFKRTIETQKTVAIKQTNHNLYMTNTQVNENIGKKRFKKTVEMNYIKSSKKDQNINIEYGAYWIIDPVDLHSQTFRIKNYMANKYLAYTSKDRYEILKKVGKISPSEEIQEGQNYDNLELGLEDFDEKNPGLSPNVIVFNAKDVNCHIDYKNIDSSTFIQLFEDRNEEKPRFLTLIKEGDRDVIKMLPESASKEGQVFSFVFPNEMRILELSFCADYEEYIDQILKHLEKS